MGAVVKFINEKMHAYDDSVVDVVGSTGGAVKELAKVEDPYATEQSSSFGDTLSWSKDEAKLPEVSDAEVESLFHPHYGIASGDGGGDAAFIDELSPFKLNRKKRLSNHWRKYISPVKWRCQWLKLRMNELHSQISKYDRQLAALSHEKELQTKMIELGCSASRAVPFASQSCRGTAMRRKNRKRTEDTSDLSLYLSNHSVLSYFENKGADNTDSAHLADKCQVPVEDITSAQNGIWIPELEPLDESSEKILLDIMFLQGHVLDLRSRVNRAAHSDAAWNVPVREGLNRHAHSSSCSPVRNADAGLLIAAQAASYVDIEYEHMVDSDASSYGEAEDVDTADSDVILPASGDPQPVNEFCKMSPGDPLASNLVPLEQNIVQHATRARMPLPRPVKIEDGSISDESATPASVMQTGPSQQGKSAAPLPATSAAPAPHYTGKKRGRKPKKRKTNKRFNDPLPSWSTKRVRKK